MFLAGSAISLINDDEEEEEEVIIIAEEESADDELLEIKTCWTAASTATTS